jgi:hypothetical protein
MRQIVESSRKLPAKGVPLVGVAKPCGEDLTSKSTVRYTYIVLIYYTMTDRSQVHRFIDAEAQVDDESEIQRMARVAVSRIAILSMYSCLSSTYSGLYQHRG